MFIEENHQISLMQFFSTIEQAVPEVRWFFHVPNGGHRHIGVAQKMKRSGVKAGVPDLLLPFRTERFVGLCIELKVGRNKTTSAQAEWLEHFRSQGWLVYIDYDWTHAASHTLAYLGHAPERWGLPRLPDCVSITTRKEL